MMLHRSRHFAAGGAENGVALIPPDRLPVVNIQLHQILRTVTSLHVIQIEIKLVSLHNHHIRFPHLYAQLSVIAETFIRPWPVLPELAPVVATQSQYSLSIAHVDGAVGNCRRREHTRKRDLPELPPVAGPQSDDKALILGERRGRIGGAGREVALAQIDDAINDNRGIFRGPMFFPPPTPYQY